MPITEYQKWAAEAVNIGGFWSTGKLQTIDEKSKKDLLQAQYDALKAKGFFSESEKRKKTEASSAESN